MTATCHVNIQEAKNNLSKLLARANAGEEIIICKAGKPYAKLVTIGRSVQRELGFLRDSFSKAELDALDKALFEPLDDSELTFWYDAPVFQTTQFADREDLDENAEQ